MRGQYRGYRDVPRVAADSTVETFAALRLHLDTWRWGGVPFYVRAGKCLPVTATEVLVELKRPPHDVFDEAELRDADYFRFRLTPDMSISLGARAKRPGEAFVGEAVELFACSPERDRAPALPAPHRRCDAGRSVAVRPGGFRGGRLARRGRDPRRPDAAPRLRARARGARRRRPASWREGDHWHDPMVAMPAAARTPAPAS